MADKRVAESSDEDDLLPQRKRPRIPIISSWIVDGLKTYNMEMILSQEPFIRKIVRDEVDRTIHRFIGGRCMPKQIERPDGRNLKLHFKTKLPSSMFTGDEIEGEEGAVIHVFLLDSKTGSRVTSGPEASAKLNVFVLDGDFNKEENDNWTEDEFEKHIVRERKGKRPLLTGDLQVSLEEGAGILGKLSFTDNSSWKRCRKFMLGLKVATGCCTATRIREAMTGRFMVKERRGQLHKKHHPPALNDDLWRLETIRKDGAFQKKLNEKGIQTVEDFLTSLFNDHQGLRNVIGSGMSEKNWKKLVGHAKATVLSSEPCVYYLDETKHIGAIFNKKHDFWGLVEGDQFTSVECLNDRQKDLEDTLVKMARANWSCTGVYHCKKMKFTKSYPTIAPQKSPMFDSAGCSFSCGGFVSIRYDGNLAAKLPDQPHNAESITYMQIASTCSSDPQVAGDVDKIMTELQPVSHTSKAHQGQSNDDDLEAWVRSMQTSPAVPYSPAIPDQDHAGVYGDWLNSCFSSTRAAVVAWVKVVTALRWAFFIRKKATDRRRAIGYDMNNLD